MKLIRVLLVLLSIPGVLVTLYAGLIFAKLVIDEIHPDPSNIAHGMAMAHAFVPALFWMIAGLLYLAALRILWLLTRWLCNRKARSDLPSD
jgi:hypothetical protein